MSAMPIDVLEKRATGLLRDAGQRVTKPRVAVLACLLEAGGEHLSADEVLTQVAARTAGVHRATVYRTLDGLADVGLLRHVHLDRGLTAYHVIEPTPKPSHHEHLHAQCAGCGRVVDLPADVLGDTAERVRRISGFQLDATHVALSGHCKDCAAHSHI